jgi:hypothetical protein
MPRPRLLARIKVGRVSIDVYDQQTLFALLEWAERVGMRVGSPTEEPVGGGETETGSAEGPGEVEVPEFARENPWLAVIAKRG